MDSDGAELGLTELRFIELPPELLRAKLPLQKWAKAEGISKVERPEQGADDAGKHWIEVSGEAKAVMKLEKTIRAFFSSQVGLIRAAARREAKGKTGAGEAAQASAGITAATAPLPLAAHPPVARRLASSSSSPSRAAVSASASAAAPAPTPMPAATGSATPRAPPLTFLKTTAPAATSAAASRASVVIFVKVPTGLASGLRGRVLEALKGQEPTVTRLELGRVVNNSSWRKLEIEGPKFFAVKRLENTILAWIEQETEKVREKEEEKRTQVEFEEVARALGSADVFPALPPPAASEAAVGTAVPEQSPYFLVTKLKAAFAKKLQSSPALLECWQRSQPGHLRVKVSDWGHGVGWRVEIRGSSASSVSRIQELLFQWVGEQKARPVPPQLPQGFAAIEARRQARQHSLVLTSVARPDFLDRSTFGKRRAAEKKERFKRNNRSFRGAFRRDEGAAAPSAAGK